MYRKASEILISSYQITRSDPGDTFEFILNDHLQVMDCIRLEPASHGVIQSMKDAMRKLDGMLFELHHVRVNPTLDNSHIIGLLTTALYQIGVRVSNQPAQTSMAVCFKPLGEISDNVRFYLNKEGKLVFLSPTTRPRLVYSKPTN